MQVRTIRFFVLILLAGVHAGCDYQTARDRYDHQIAVCELAQRNGLLKEAVEACGAALSIAEQEQYAPALMMELLYRLGSLERQGRELERAEAMVRRSLVFAETANDEKAIAVRLVELSLSVVGQGRLEESVALLERALPLVDQLDGEEREAAANVYRGIGLRLQRKDPGEQADRLLAKAEALRAEE